MSENNNDNESTDSKARLEQQAKLNSLTIKRDVSPTKTLREWVNEQLSKDRE